MNLQMGNRGAKTDPGPAFPWDRILWPNGTSMVRYNYVTRDWQEEHVFPPDIVTP